ncbi:hypothetical protein SV7mr_33760 [Stieleria bergensis]|uniref:Cbb3-type cytochrome oxidase component FixQ n=1 Tax=Stieleria bergensis TaxID=2528025 RepID=A0A517SXH4_9BACT|nr:hypothetical protein SV7mr_33760 [Planctomycetes bacterium SV_7m_r]
MLKEVVSFLNYSACAELALLFFVCTFLFIMFGAMRLSKGASERFASIPLSDDVEDPRS